MLLLVFVLLQIGDEKIKASLLMPSKVRHCIGVKP